MPDRLLECLRFGTAIAAGPSNLKGLNQAAYRRIWRRFSSTAGSYRFCKFFAENGLRARLFAHCHPHVHFTGRQKRELDPLEPHLGKQSLGGFKRSNVPFLSAEVQFQGFGALGQVGLGGATE